MYNDLTTYTVEVVSLDYDSLIEMTISDGSNDYDLSVDVDNETISLESIHSSTFSAYESYEVSSSANVIENISNVLMIHHAMYALTSENFDNNGSSDTFPDDPTGLKFWGWQHKVDVGPCVNGSRTVKDCYKVIFISVDCNTHLGPCGP